MGVNVIVLMNGHFVRLSWNMLLWIVTLASGLHPHRLPIDPPTGCTPIALAVLRILLYDTAVISLPLL